jgi:hypothetical protein
MLRGVLVGVIGVEKFLESVLQFDVVLSGKILTEEKFQAGRERGDEIGLLVLIEIKDVVIELLGDVELRAQGKGAVAENEDVGGFQSEQITGGRRRCGPHQPITKTICAGFLHQLVAFNHLKTGSLILGLERTLWNAETLRPVKRHVNTSEKRTPAKQQVRQGERFGEIQLSCH